MTAPTIWVTPNQHSAVVCGALARGTGFPIRSVLDAHREPGPSIVYGVLRGCSEIIQRCQVSGLDFWHIDHGYWGRGHYGGFYRISHNGLQADYTKRDKVDVDVLPQRDVPFQFEPWRYILTVEKPQIWLMPPTVPQAAHFGQPAKEWENRILWMLEQAGFKGEVVVCRKGEHVVSDETIAATPELCGLIAFNSSAAYSALVHGVPVVSDRITPIHMLCGGVSDIVNGTDRAYPPISVRAHLFRWLSFHQFTLDEFANGFAWRWVKELQD